MQVGSRCPYDVMLQLDEKVHSAEDPPDDDDEHIERSESLEK
jgi:hypothetical protein